MITAKSGHVNRHTHNTAKCGEAQTANSYLLFVTYISETVFPSSIFVACNQVVTIFYDCIFMWKAIVRTNRYSPLIRLIYVWNWWIMQLLNCIYSMLAWLVLNAQVSTMSGIPCERDYAEIGSRLENTEWFPTNSCSKETVLVVYFFQSSSPWKMKRW